MRGKDFTEKTLDLESKGVRQLIGFLAREPVGFTLKRIYIENNLC